MISVVCSDAGGAEVISSWLVKKNISFRLTAYGPAIKIFKKKFKNIRFYSLVENIKKTEFLLTGTSVKNYELVAISYARKKNIKIISYLDSWSEYKIRFKFKDYYIFPDEIWVCDKFAYKIGKKTFKNVPIKLIGNYYFKALRELQKKTNSIVNKKKIVFVSTPIKESAKIKYNNPNYYGYTEDDIISFFLRDSIGLNLKNAEIFIQIHPRENLDTYDFLIKRFNYNIKINKKKNLYDSLQNANIVIGCNSMALAVARIALGKKTFNILPKGVKSIIPYKGIKSISFNQYKNNSDY